MSIFSGNQLLHLPILPCHNALICVTLRAKERIWAAITIGTSKTVRDRRDPLINICFYTFF
ncbi:hypothetical protein [Trichormus azollae]|jgi:hypothetical protein|uniref:Uncharacterized protein n=1 Tax=Nostoc azollae (strain 0708) TaxID=551115 RepID=D7E530_NOSA0|nr:hypothetical protein [Trichormus azollae]ADI63827.1 hypothetical protein Aazo_1662 ['Nostoc azollae' 0708]